MFRLDRMGANMRRGFLGAVLLAGLGACATQQPYQQADMNPDVDDNRGVYSPAGRMSLDSAVQDRAAALFAELAGVRPDSFELRDSIVSRVNIGGANRAEIAAHEDGAPGPTASDKANNDLNMPTKAPESLLLNTQNNLMDNGWRKGNGGYIHLPSGFVCPNTLSMVIENEDTNITTTLNMPINDIRMFNEQGTDTACDYVDANSTAYLTVFVSQWSHITLTDHYSSALQHIVDRFAVASEATLITPNMDLNFDGGHQSTIEAETMSGAFLLEPQEGIQAKTALWLNKTNDWHVKARATYVLAMEGTEPTLMPAELLATVFHAATLYNVDKHINTGGGGVEVSY